MQQRRISISLIIAATVGASLLFTSTIKQLLPSSLSDVQGRLLPLRSDAEYISHDSLRSDSLDLKQDAESSTHNCQFVFIIGVEGALHHELSPILKKMAQLQKDPITGQSYKTPSDIDQQTFKRAIYSMDGLPSAEQASDFMSKICPSDGLKRIYFDGKTTSPLGLKNHDKKWSKMTPLEISLTPLANNEPTNFKNMVEAYSPYADIKFIVLHRPYLETIAHHRRRDGGVIGHSNVIRGHMILLREFLDTHISDKSGERLWTVFCTQSMLLKNYETQEEAQVARRNVIGHLANFLGWPQAECPSCFDEWPETTNNRADRLDVKDVEVLFDHIKSLVGVWPPRDDTVPVDPRFCQL